ncbi:3-methyl-2-oxobutanoate hydroxymethyltransferase [Desulfurispira natronophila]|uniref:3-methyl-2-oxobutanoate hydroxymethyltransferase n=1 Tax=Desulfurispira natronophila TaxID=682562 RepID=A0A7W7Y2X2_9BACT|nr:3-methyl-2-oxobutanoate hydroxymethyltransferase [Desulfurispira natronophila]MBB5021053.1 3-methyl-2-oxobutanoate hydroxymethyltransferase [Desulfurispira natronophila]
MSKVLELSKITTTALANLKAEGEKIAMLTAYDYTFARLADQAGMEVLLVGDSVGMVFSGLENTLPVTLDQMIYHTQAVARGSKRALVVADMPFMTYQVSPQQALQNAGRLVQEGRAEAVKLEGGAAMAATISAIVTAGIPVMGHVGLTPQSVHAIGGFRVQGKGHDAAQAVLEDALAVQDAGAFALVLEGIPASLGQQITQQLTIPTIGIGAGADCDGQVLVMHDLLGLFDEFTPKFVKRYASVGETVEKAFREYQSEVKSSCFPQPQNCFKG